MVRWLVVVALLIAVASFAAWFADQYLCDTLPEGAGLCLGTRP